MQFKELESKIVMYLQNTNKIENFVMFYQLASFINMPNFSKVIKCYLYRCFTMVAETKSFLKLDVSFVAQILSESQLNITSELEVFKAADDWLRYNINDRSKFAKELLLKVRLPLLSDRALNYVLRKDSSFRNSKECLVLVKHILKENNIFRNSKYFSCTTRYCNQNTFNILTFNKSALPSLNLVRYDINKNTLTSVKHFPQLGQVRRYPRAVSFNGDFYVFCCIENIRKPGMSVQKYSSSSNSWEVVAKYSKKCIQGFCVCVYMNKIYLIGGQTLGNGISFMNNCFEFNPVNYKIRKVKRMNAIRVGAACTVFEGNVVVSGGFDGFGGFVGGQTVETYDHVADTWSYMPSMVEGRKSHDLVAIKNKLFAIGGRENTCEVYDSCSKKFYLLKSPQKKFKFNFDNAAFAFSMADKIIVFDGAIKFGGCFDLNKEEWSEQLIEMVDDYIFSGCFKLPQF